MCVFLWCVPHREHERVGLFFLLWLESFQLEQVEIEGLRRSCNNSMQWKKSQFFRSSSLLLSPACPACFFYCQKRVLMVWFLFWHNSPSECFTGMWYQVNWSKKADFWEKQGSGTDKECLALDKICAMFFMLFIENTWGDVFPKKQQCRKSCTRALRKHEHK